DFLGHSRDQVAAANLHGLNFVARVRRTDGDLYELRGPLADEQVVLALDVLDDGLVHLVTGHADRARKHDTAQRDDGDLGGAAADVDDHVTGRLGDRKAGADRRRHRLFDQIDFARPGRFCRFAHRAFLDRGNSEGYADHDPRTRPHQSFARVCLLDEVTQHVFRDFEVGDHAVTQRANRGNRTARPPPSPATPLHYAAPGRYLIVSP